MTHSRSKPKTQEANIHQRVRRQHATELAQDYLEAIYNWRKHQTPLKVNDLKNIFGVSHVTVIRTLKRLEEQGLISGSRSKKIELTQKGEAVAKSASQKHALLREFFIALGVSEAQADADAEGAEHHLSKETLTAVRRFLDTANESTNNKIV